VKTLQQKQKSLEYKESKAIGAGCLQRTETQSDPCQSVTVEHTCDTLSYDSKDPLLSSVKSRCLFHNDQPWTTNVVQSCARKVGEFRTTLTVSNPGGEHSNKTDIIHGTRLLSTVSSSAKDTVAEPVTKAKGSSKSSRSKNRKTRTPFIEHQEDKRTSFSRASFVTLQERLSSDEMQILSQLARASSLPDDVRNSLHAYLDRQKAFAVGDHVCSVDNVPKFDHGPDDHSLTLPAAKKKRAKGSKKQTVTVQSEPLWNAEDVKDPERLKTLLERTAKLLSDNKKILLDRAVERERLMKENAYHDRMASFVELCINTGMVSMQKYRFCTVFFSLRTVKIFCDAAVKSFVKIQLINCIGNIC